MNDTQGSSEPQEPDPTISEARIELPSSSPLPPCDNAASPNPAQESKLDFEHADFDPELALITMRRPSERILRNKIFQSAKPLDNIKSCSTIVHKPYKVLTRSLRTNANDVALSGQIQGSVEISVNGIVSVETAPLPDKQPALTSEPLFHAGLDSLNEMHAEVMDIYPPFELLGRCIETNATIQVLIRSTHRLECRLTGCLVAFDEHMNLIMRKAEEHSIHEGKTRYLGQLFLRGEHVVSIAAPIKEPGYLFLCTSL